MKPLKAKILPSGSWRVQIMVNGEKISVTAPTEEAAVLKAMNIKHGAAQYNKDPISITLDEAYNRYIESKDAILSPSTIYGYKKLKRNTFQGLMGKPLKSLTSDQIQREINKMAKTLSPKTIRNAQGLLSAVLGEYNPGFTVKTSLPPKTKTEISIPTEEETEKIFSMSKGTVMELPLILAIWIGLRASEISAIRWDAIRGNILHIKEAKVYGEDGYVSKKPKSFSGDRKIEIPDYILNLINKQPRINDYVIQLTGGAIYKRFVRMCDKNGVQHFRLHDLRHSNASVMLALGIPDKYAMQRMGHATSNMLKTVYQHTMSEKMQQVNNKVNDYFLNLISHENSHDE